MAYNRGYRAGQRRKSYGNNRNSNSKFSEAEKLAYKMGCIDRGKQNPNSRVYESYLNGLSGITSKDNKKTLY